MISLDIKVPIWSTESIGISSKLVQADNVMIEITISYKDKDGNQPYPHRYYTKTNLVREYPTQMRKGTELHIVPIADLHAVEEHERLL